MKYEIKILTDSIEKSETCEKIIRRLPQWFGVKDANRKYIQEASELSALAVKQGNENVALLLYKQLHDSSLGQIVMDIHWLGVLPELHGKGLGKNLVKTLNDIAKSGGVACLTVDTLDPAIEDEDYLKTFGFYKGIGFSVFHRFSHDEKNPMVRMKMPVRS